MTKEEEKLHKESISKYPIGAIVKSLDRNYLDKEMTIANHKFYTLTKNGLYMNGEEYCPMVYEISTQKWAEIIKIPYVNLIEELQLV